MLSESLERRAERSKREADDEVDEEEEENLADEAEREEELVQNIIECIGAFLKAYRSAVLPLFDQLLLPAFQGMIQPTAITTDRVAALCVFDDIIEHCSADGASSKYIPVLKPAFLQYASDEAVEVRQAAVYGLGVLAANAQAQDFTDTDRQQAANVLLAMVEHPEAFHVENATASDNAVSALGKLCYSNEGIARHVLPRWLAKLPLRADREEARTVHTKLVEMTESHFKPLLGESHEHLPSVICVFGQLLGTDLIEEELNARIGNLLKQVRDGLPQVLQALPSYPGFAALTPEHRSALERAISS